MTPEGKLELGELLEYRTRSALDIRRDRFIASGETPWHVGKRKVYGPGTCETDGAGTPP
jgi:hypothetical protein